MNPENTVLLLAVILGFVHLFLQAMMASAQRGTAWNLSSRDKPLPPLTGMAGRAERAFANFRETFPFFLAAVFLVMQTGHGGNLSAIGAYCYLTGRLLYVPFYLFNVIGARTAAFMLAAVGIVLILVQAALG